MADRVCSLKRPSSGDSSDEKKEKRQIGYKTFEKWQVQYNSEFKTLTWLRCETEGLTRVVTLLWCDVCWMYERKICSQKNFSRTWIEGSANHRTSNVLDHAKSSQHKMAMDCLKFDQAKERNQSLATVAPIVGSLSKLDVTARERLRRKFDLCFVLAKEGIPFTKYAPFHQLEVRHEVDLGLSYTNDVAAKCFSHYIAESQWKSHADFVQENVPYFSFLMDGTTDVSKMEDEAVVMLYCKKDDFTKEIKSCTRYLSVANPNAITTDGLLQCLEEVLKHMVGIQDICEPSSVLGVKPILVGGGTDGASVNISQHNSIKARLLESIPWIFWSWCYAHRLELSLRDGLSSQLFRSIEEMLLRLYYLYEKSAKMVRQLKEVVEDLKEVYNFSEGGCIPVRSQGSRWITHKRRALQKVVDQYGAYITHLITLCEDKTIKSEDRARLKGYVQKWTQSKILIGCAMYVEILKGPSILSLCLQKSDCDIVYGLKQILKVADSIRSLRRQDPSLWPTVKLMMEKIDSEGSIVCYQGAEIKNYTSATLESCKKQALGDLERLNKTIQQRLEWSDVRLLRALIAFIDTQSWIKRQSSVSDNEEEDTSLEQVNGAIELLSSHFRNQLEAIGVDIRSLRDEMEDVVIYARAYLSIETTDYRKVWYNLFICPNSSDWPNILLLCKLAFSLPFSNARVEQIFSSLKYIKNIKRNTLNISTLDDLIEIYIEGPTLENFCADSTIDLWLDDCPTSRRPHQCTRKLYRPREKKGDSAGSSSEKAAEDGGETDDEECNFALDKWHTWFSDDSDDDVSESD